MNSHEALKEDTWLKNRYFPINVFHNSSHHASVLNIHWHDHIEILLMREGAASFNIGAEVVMAKPRDIVFVNSGLLHSGINACEGQTVHYDAIVFSKALLASYAPDPHHMECINPFLEGHLHFPIHVKESEVLHGVLYPLLKNLTEEMEQQKQGYEIMVKSYIQQLTALISRNFFHDKPSEKPSLAYDNNIENIKRLILHIERHYSEKLTVKEAAAFVNLSPYYFCKSFKRMTGRTFIEFLNLYRIQQAEMLLKGSPHSVTEISEKVGFCNINYFDRLFRQYRKCSPTEIRK